jgi:uncharacterized protein (TIGR00730 family)
MPPAAASTPPATHRICVFLGASHGRRPAYAQAAEDLGRKLALRGLGLVYGGGNVGLMGQLARAALEAGGEVIGVIPEALMGREVSGTRIEDVGATRLEIVDSMHTRKARMAELADGFIALPGGYGTFEELFEILTWAQLGFHRKPIGILNTEAYFDPLIRLIDHSLEEEFIRPKNRALVIDDTDPDRLLQRLLETAIPRQEQWLESADTL